MTKNIFWCYIYTNVFHMCDMVPIFSFGERWNVLLNFALPRWKKHPIFHLMKISISLSLFVFVEVLMSLLNIWGHIMTVPACSSCCFDQCAATQECHATDTGHDTPPNQSIQTQGRPNVLSIDVKRHFGQWGKLSAPVYNRIKAVHIIDNSYIKNQTTL